MGGTLIKVVILGSAAAVGDESHANTHMVLAAQQRMVLVDCPGEPLLRLKAAGLDYQRLTDVILTHFHPDHVSGLPHFLMNLWLLGRKNSLNIYGLAHTIERTKKLIDLFELLSLPGFFPVDFIQLPQQEICPVLESEDVRIYSSPVRHIIPGLGLRVEARLSGKSLAYSSDTEPCPEVVRLGYQSDVLIHEATGAGFGHSSAGQAGEIAHQAGVKRLVLIHYPVVNQTDIRQKVNQAMEHFSGRVDLAEDLMQIEL